MWMPRSKDIGSMRLVGEGEDVALRVRWKDVACEGRRTVLMIHDIAAL